MTGHGAATARRRPEQARSRERVEQVLDATRELIAERGIEPTTITDIAKRAGMAVTALYRYFPNKQAIVRELTVRTLEHDARTLVIPLLSGGTDVSDLVHSGISAYWHRNRDEPFRRNLRVAIHADAELAALDFDDNRRNAAALAERLAGLTGRTDIDRLQQVMLLCLSLLDGLIWLASQTAEAEARGIIDSYARMITHEVMRTG